MRANGREREPHETVKTSARKISIPTEPRLWNVGIGTSLNGPSPARKGLPSVAAAARVDRELTNLGRAVSHYGPVSSYYSEKYPCKSPSNRAKLDPGEAICPFCADSRKSTKDGDPSNVSFFASNRNATRIVILRRCKGRCNFNNTHLTKTIR